MRLARPDAPVDLAAHEVEFARWRWMTPDEIVAAIVPFKRPVYREVLRQFAPRLG